MPNADAQTSKTEQPAEEPLTLHQIFGGRSSCAFGPLSTTVGNIDRARSFEVCANGSPLKLPPIDSQLLCLLVAFEGRPLTTGHLKEIFDRFSDRSLEALRNNFKVHIHHIREALKKAGVGVRILPTNPRRKTGECGRYNPHPGYRLHVQEPNEPQTR